MPRRTGTKKQEQKTERKPLKDCGNGARFSWLNPNRDKENIIGYLTIKIDGFVFHNLRLIRRKDGTANFIAFPSQENNGKYYTHVYVEDAEIMDAMETFANNALYAGGEWWEDDEEMPFK